MITPTWESIVTLFNFAQLTGLLSDFQSCYKKFIQQKAFGIFSKNLEPH